MNLCVPVPKSVTVRLSPGAMIVGPNIFGSCASGTGSSPPSNWLISGIIPPPKSSTSVKEWLSPPVLIALRDSPCLIVAWLGVNFQASCPSSSTRASRNSPKVTLPSKSSSHRFCPNKPVLPRLAQHAGKGLAGLRGKGMKFINDEVMGAPGCAVSPA